MYDDPHKHTGIVAGCAGLGSIIAIMFTYPLDNIRIRQQANKEGSISLYFRYLNAWNI